MRFTSVPILAGLTALATAQQPGLAAQLQTLNGLVSQLQGTLSDWQGGYTSMIPIIVPTLQQSIQALSTINSINNLAQTSGPLDEQGADQVIQALQVIHEQRPIVGQTLAAKKAAFADLNPAYLQGVSLAVSTFGGLSDKGHAAIVAAVPDDKKAEVQQLWEQSKSDLQQVLQDYSS